MKLVLLIVVVAVVLYFGNLAIGLGTAAFLGLFP